MNFEEWKQTCRHVEFLEAENDTSPALPGYIYEDGSWIAIIKGLSVIEYFAIVGNEECWSKDKGTVEEYLWTNWSESNYQ